MAQNDSMNEEMERYLQDELSAGERQAFEARLAADPELRRELALLRAVENTLGDTREEELTETLRRMRPARRRRLFAQIPAAAASIALLAIVYILFLRPDTDPIADYLQTQAMDMVEMSTYNALLSRAEPRYNDGRYAEALPILQEYLEENPEDAEARLFAAQSALGAEEYSLARSLLTPLEGQPLIAAEITWLQALSWWGEDRREQAEPLLRMLLESEDAAMRERAESLLEQMQ